MQKTATLIKQTTKLSPQQIMVATMVQASTEELQKLIDDELQKNIALESDDSRSVDQMSGTVESDEESDGFADGVDNEDYDDNEEVKESVVDYGDDDPVEASDQSEEKEYSPITNYGSDVSFRESLKEQVSMLDIDDDETFLANYIIESLEDDGYLRRPLYELVDDLEWHQNYDTTEEQLQHVLVDVIQANLEPAGIGARDLRECLLLQLLDKKSTDAVLKAYKVVDEAFDDFSARRLDKIKARFDFSDRDISDIQKIVHHLNPKPGGVTSSTDTIATKASHVRPDFIVTNEDGTLVVSLCDCRVPAVRISPDYNEMLQRIMHEKSNREDVLKGKAMIEEGIRSANMFINALIQRRQTLLAVMRVIVNIQREYFISGKIETLQPMTLKNVSELSGYDISTISRVSNSRFVQTDFGTFSIKELFTTGIASDTGAPAVSNAAVKNALKELVDNEDKHHPLNDDELVKQLGEMGYTIARRTVVKYRDALGISKANLRKI